MLKRNACLAEFLSVWNFETTNHPLAMPIQSATNAAA